MLSLGMSNYRQIFNFISDQPSFYVLPCCLALLCDHMPSAGLTQWWLAANFILYFPGKREREKNIAMVTITLHLPFHCFHGSLPEKVPMMYSATPATVSAATTPATSVPYAATATANQVCSFLKLSVINPWAFNKCFIFKSGELLRQHSVALLALPIIKLHLPVDLQ